MKGKETQKVGIVLSSLLTKCPDAIRGCVVSKETYDKSLYLTFEKGDHLQLTDMNLQVRGWWYAINLRTHDEGFVHPFYTRTMMGLLGATAVALYGLTLNGVDVITDFLSGIAYLEGDSLPLDDLMTEENCIELNTYSHPTWGYIAIGLAWLPAVPVFITSLSTMLTYPRRKDEKHIQKTLHYPIWTKKRGGKATAINCWSIVSVCLFWPLSSFLM